MDWWEMTLLVVVPFLVALLATVIPNEIRGRRRDRIDIEAHEAYMNGGGYPAFYEVYRRYGINKRGK
jgi:hypothetical protein